MTSCKSNWGSTTKWTTGVNLDLSRKRLVKEITPVAQSDFDPHADFDPYALFDALRAGEDVDLIRSSVELVLQSLIEAEVTATIGASPYKRSEERQNYRNRHRPRLLSTKAGDIELQIPKLRSGSFFPQILGVAAGSTGRCSPW
jgi:hypothetical protein